MLQNSSTYPRLESLPPAVSPAEYDFMLQDVSTHISRQELLRRLSTHSSSTSGSSRRGSTRIAKPTSASNSPHHIQRRRTTANHCTRVYPKVPQDHSYHIREQRLQSYNTFRSSTQTPRPLSWHPSSESFSARVVRMPTSEPTLRNAIAGMEGLAVSNTPDFSVQQSIQSAFASGYGYPINAPPTTYPQFPSTNEGHGISNAGPGLSCDSYPVYSISDQVQYPFISQPPVYETMPATHAQQSQQWPQSDAYFPIFSQVPQNIPEVPPMPAQALGQSARKNKATSAPQLRRKKSKELVGMGLYDDRGSNFLSGINSAVGAELKVGSLGKGLKLEETWQPPNEDEEEEDDNDDYSTDEADEVEEAPLPIMTQNSAKSSTALGPTYNNDMSNQSFFFNDDDDDDFSNQTRYENYLTYGQFIPDTHTQTQMNTGLQNYVWL